MMSIQYAKKQVLESIKYWMKVLEELDEKFMKKIEQVDESTLLAPPLSALKSTEYTKIGKKSIRFMLYGDL